MIQEVLFCNDLKGFVGISNKTKRVFPEGATENQSWNSYSQDSGLALDSRSANRSLAKAEISQVFCLF